MWKAPADHQALQLSSAKIPGSHGLSEGLNCASCYIHAAFSHPNISALFKGPGNSSSHRTATLYVFHLASGVHVPTIVVQLVFPPSATYSRREFVSVRRQTHTLSSYNSSPSSSHLDCEVCPACTVLRERAFSLSLYVGFTGSSIHIHSLSLFPKIEWGEGVLAHYHIVSCLKPV